MPVHVTSGGIVCFGPGRASSAASLMGLCGERGVAISMLSESGMFRARINGFTSGNVLLRRQQYRLTDDPAGSAGIARAVVSAKVANARSVLLRTMRDARNAGPAASGRGWDRRRPADGHGPGATATAAPSTAR